MHRAQLWAQWQIFMKKLKTCGYIKAVYAPGDPNPQTQNC
jgi:hypothetical protein